ncbi:ricin-type beta-trefoil lectin domain protein [Streptomyces sp. NBC_01571]|uniref:RICIN domain-containing protein n=1 Tax=Streptomyces sp. NBC_01571 TaxID=2975883 RepID=UPI0022526111|nr:ricin-type beta-trefoil lectin domain protein [Streptomyces sp. NBC_01571]MCX4581375.1 ricin-type beta-trefoil lectin domain protein [Streptomyces sp. NBC_01571]
MDYCEHCRRRLNGALNCPGCGTILWTPKAPDSGDLQNKIVTPPGEQDLPPLAPCREQAPVPTPAREQHPGATSQKLRRLPLVLSAAGLVVSVIMAALTITDPPHRPPASDVVTAVGTDRPGEGLPVVPPPGRPASAGTPTHPARPSTTVTATTTATTAVLPTATTPAKPSATVTAANGSTSPRPTPTHTTAPTYPGSVVSSTGMCLTSGQDTAHGGTSLLLAPCNGTDTQQWQALADGSLRNGSDNRCLDVVNGEAANGSTVQLFTCNTTPAQKWARDALQEIVNPHSGRCLDASTVAITNCTGQANQQWTMP